MDNMIRRTRAKILTEILELCQEPTRITPIVYGCNLNFSIVKRYISWCFSNGWLKKTDKTYQTTELGTSYLNILIPVVKMTQF